MKAARGIEMLEISAMIMGQVNVIHPTLIWDEDAVILVDTGFPGQPHRRSSGHPPGSAA